jgi:hypothetical protein
MLISMTITIILDDIPISDEKIKGPDNPTSQLLPLIRNNS